MAVPVRMWGRVAGVLLFEALRRPNSDKKIVINGNHISVTVEDKPQTIAGGGSTVAG